jgi:predicted transcriptional regulator
MKTKKKFRYGTIKKVSETLGVSYQTAVQRIHRGDISALTAALDIEEKTMEEMKRIQKRLDKLSAA